MTNKQIIIDEVCKWKTENNEGVCLLRCENTEDCYYKQLKRLQAELEAKDRIIESYELSEKEANEIIGELEYKYKTLQTQYNAVVEQNSQLQKELKEVKQ